MASLQFTEGGEHPPVNTSIPKQLLPNVVDGLAQTRPHAVYALIPKSFTSYDDGYRTVTFRQLASAVNGAAWFLKEQLGTASGSQVLAYVGPNDIGYVVFILGAVKAGHTVLSLSPRNTKADHGSLFAATKCTTLLTTPPPYSPTIATIQEALTDKPRIIHIPTIYEILDGKFEHFPYPKTFAAAKDEPLVMVHTSGTTNTPKLVTYTHALAAGYVSWTQEPAPAGYENVAAMTRGQRAFTTFPFFHAGGLMIALMEQIANQVVMVTPLAGVAPSAQGVVDALKHVEVDVLHLAAPFAEQLAKNPAMLDASTKTTTLVTYGGGDVSEACANAFLSRGVAVCGFNGSTETTPYPQLRPLQGWEAADLKYIQPHPVANIEFQPTTIPDMFEAVLIRNTDESILQPVFTILPHVSEYRTKDLFSPHPSKPGLWLYRGRADDMIISASGELCNPIPFEQALTLLPAVAAVLMVGTGRYQKSLLVEPAPEALQSSEDFVDQIWPTIEAANQNYPQVSQIAKSHVLLTDPEIPLRRAAKGTVQRAPSLAVYKERIDRLYAAAGDGKAGEDGNVEPYKVHVAMNK